MALPLDFLLRANDGVSKVLGGVENRITSIGRKATEAGKKLSIGLTAPIALAGGGILRASAGFEEAVLNVQALTNATTATLAPLRAQAKTLGSETTFSARQAAQAQGVLALGGLKVNEIFEATPGILILAAAGNVKLARAAEASITVMKGQQLATTDLERINAVLVNTFTNVTTDLENLIGAFTEGGPAGKSFGQDLETTAAILGGFAEAGFQSTKAGTAFKTLLVRLATLDSPKARKALKDLGFEPGQFLDSEGQLRNVIDILGELEGAGIDGVQIVRIFGEEAGPKVAGLLGVGIDRVRELRAGLGDLERPARVAATRMAGATGSVRGFTSAVEGLAIEIADAGLLEWFTGMARGAASLARNLSKTNPVLFRVGVIVAGVAAALGPLLIGVGLLIQVGGTLLPVLKFVGAAIAFLLTPIGAVAVAIGVLIAVGVKLVGGWAKIGRAGKRMFGDLVGVIRHPINAIKSLISGLIDLTPDWLRALFGGDSPTGVTVESSAKPLGAPRPGGRGAPSFGPGGGVGGEQRIRVDFTNLPRGVDVDQREAPDIPVDIGLNLSGASA